MQARSLPGGPQTIIRSWRKSNASARHAGVVGAIPTGLTNRYGCRLTVGRETLDLAVVVRIHAPVPVHCRLSIEEPNPRSAIYNLQFTRGDGRSTGDRLAVTQETTGAAPALPPTTTLWPSRSGGRLQPVRRTCESCQGLHRGGLPEQEWVRPLTGSRRGTAAQACNSSILRHDHSGRASRLATAPVSKTALG